MDTIWSDIDYMDGYRVFTLDPINFSVPKMSKFLADLHAKGQKWVPIVDPGVKIDPGYPAYDAGIATDIFIKGPDRSPYVASVRFYSITGDFILAGIYVRSPQKSCIFIIESTC